MCQALCWDLASHSHNIPEVSLIIVPISQMWDQAQECSHRGA